MNFEEKAKGKENVGITQKTGISERIMESVLWTIKKFANQEAVKENKPFEVVSFPGNLLLNEGINELWTLVCSSSGVKYDNTNAQLGVGDSSTAESATQTGLLGGNQTWKGMDTGYPTYGTNQKAVWRATFDTAEGNYSWNEFSVRNGAAADKNLNRKVSAQGTKVAGQIWELTLEVSLS